MDDYSGCHHRSPNGVNRFVFNDILPNAPQTNINAHGEVLLYGAWPMTLGRDWCGDFEPKTGENEGEK